MNQLLRAKCIAVYCIVPQLVLVYCSVLRCVAVCVSALQFGVVWCCSVLQFVAVCCSEFRSKYRYCSSRTKSHFFDILVYQTFSAYCVGRSVSILTLEFTAAQMSDTQVS